MTHQPCVGSAALATVCDSCHEALQLLLRLGLLVHSGQLLARSRRSAAVEVPFPRHSADAGQLPRPASRARMIASARSATCSFAKIADT